MKIATWNVERLKHQKSLARITAACERVRADILVLTETDSRIRPDYRYCFSTPTPPDIGLPGYEEPLHYRPTEHRVSLFTNYKCIRQHPTFDRHTALCVELETEMGALLVYGTILGVLGNRHPTFQTDLSQQAADLRRLNGVLCICGDLNCSFADPYYYTSAGRDALRQTFAENRIRLLTENVPCCIDHIAVSEGFVSGCKTAVEEWNQDKRLSDHKGIAVELGSEGTP